MKKRCKVICLVIISAMCLSIFSSCEKAGTELSELMIMQGIGIDATDGGYKVTVEILNNEQSGSPGGNSGSENKTKIYSAEGATVAEALRTLTSRSGNTPMFAHNRVIIIGEKTANKDISDVLDVFERDYDSRPSQLLCVAKKSTAEELIRAKLLTDAVKCEILENLLEESYNQSLAPRVRIIDAINYLKEETSGLCIPAVVVEENGENQNYVLDGCAVFGLDSSFSKYIDSKTSEGLAFLNNQVKKGFVTAELPNGEKATFLINKGKTKYEITEENGVLTYHLKISLSCDLDQVEGDEYFSTDEGVIETFQKAVGEAVCKKAENTIIVLKDSKGADVIRYGKQLRNSDNALYSFLKEDWNSAFSSAKTVITADVTIRRIGEETFHSKKQ